MADDVRVSTALPTHPKTLRLEHALGPAGFAALVKLFCWAGDHRPDGDLSGISDDDLELSVGWKQKQRLIPVLAKVGFLEGKARSRRIHDWNYHQPFVATKSQRIERARLAAAARWQKASPEQKREQAKKAAAARWNPQTADACAEQASGTHGAKTDACAEQAECMPSTPHHAHHTTPPSSSNKSKQELEVSSVRKQQKQNGKRPAAAAIARAFEIIGVTPFGPKRFQDVITAYLIAREPFKTYQAIEDALEEALQRCEEEGTPRPPKVFEVKRIIEKKAAEELAFRAGVQ